MIKPLGKVLKWRTKEYDYRCFGDYRTLLQPILDNPDDFLSHAAKVLKDDPTSTVGKIQFQGQTWVIKRTNASKTKGLKRFFSSRAKRNFYNALYLLKHDICSFMPYATIEERASPYRSYLICSFEEGIQALDFYAKGKPTLPQWQEKAPLLFELLSKLEKAKIAHRDLNLSNLLWQTDKWVLLDLDGMRIHTALTAWVGALRDRMRFMRNWDEYKTVDPSVKEFFKQLYDQFYGPKVLRK